MNVLLQGADRLGNKGDSHGVIHQLGHRKTDQPMGLTNQTASRDRRSAPVKACPIVDQYTLLSRDDVALLYLMERYSIAWAGIVWCSILRYSKSHTEQITSSRSRLIYNSVWFSRENQLNLSFIMFYNSMCHTQATSCFSWHDSRDIAVYFHKGNYSQLLKKLRESFSSEKINRSAATPSHAMPPEGSTRAWILPGCPNLDRGNRDAEVRFEPWPFCTRRKQHFGAVLSIPDKGEIPGLYLLALQHCQIGEISVEASQYSYPKVDSKLRIEA
ncbi:hypothetical protein T265_10487 [Opisthorchis viverrini]|uniref:Uncharacterized protein n=1 Tax=Opisthorchis viverrini TaxID=6198 RepID=A0A074Z6E6_OPIVI|nr:hypothetical protein T265_10487 [Opisthorchis viverrini]KER21127.1 hypothetical protein T265_10487 [Opisthorchis viverrini]